MACSLGAMPGHIEVSVIESAIEFRSLLDSTLCWRAIANAPLSDSGFADAIRSVMISACYGT